MCLCCGYSHVNEFVARLAGAGFKDISFSKQDQDKLFSLSGNPLIFPNGMKQYIQKRIDLDKESLKSETDSKVISSYENAINDRQKLLELIDKIVEKQ